MSEITITPKQRDWIASEIVPRAIKKNSAKLKEVYDLLKAHTADPWVSMEENPPEKDDLYLCWLIEDGYKLLWYINKQWWEEPTMERVPAPLISHWTTGMPAPPKS